MPKKNSTPARKPNPGQFKPGPDPRRHKFTREECARGFWEAIAIWGVGMGEKLHAAGRWPSYKRA
jgi:hypothetical protein